MAKLLLKELYRLHERGELGNDDPRWLEVDAQINLLVSAVVRRAFPNVFGAPHEHLRELVHTSILTKFVSKKFGDARNFNSVITTAAHRDAISAGRRSRGPTTSGDEHIEHWHEDGVEGRAGGVCLSRDFTEPVSMFDGVREYFAPFRFPEHNYAREVLLIYFLIRGRYPAPAFLKSYGVRSSRCDVVFNAAVFDVNTALHQVTDED